MAQHEGSVLCDGPTRFLVFALCLPMASFVRLGGSIILTRERDLELCNPCLSILITSLISLQESNFTVVIILFNPTVS